MEAKQLSRSRRPGRGRRDRLMGKLPSGRRPHGLALDRQAFKRSKPSGSASQRRGCGRQQRFAFKVPGPSVLGKNEGGSSNLWTACASAPWCRNSGLQARGRQRLWRPGRLGPSRGRPQEPRRRASTSNGKPLRAPGWADNPRRIRNRGDGQHGQKERGATTLAWDATARWRGKPGQGDARWS